MKRVSLSLLLVFSFPLTAQTPSPAITSIRPAAGPVEGGTVVTITGSNLMVPPNFACLLPCPTTVRFGSEEATVIEERDTFVSVRTPAHVAGTVDVTLRTGDNRSVTVAKAFTFIPTGESGYATFLLPVYSDGDVSGARGSRWRTEFWIRNNGTRNVQLAPWDCPAGQACPAIFPLTRTLRPKENVRNLPPFLRVPTGNPGRMLFVTDEGANEVTMSLRLWDVSRQDIDAGTEIPVVSADELLTTTAHLLSVPAGNLNFRQMLRVYDVAQRESRFRVRVYGQAAGTAADGPLQTFELTARTPDEGPFRFEPAYAQYGELVTSTLLRIEVEPLTPGSLFWTFLAITNNETQRVTLVTPQP